MENHKKRSINSDNHIHHNHKLSKKAQKTTKFILVTGGVVSGVGKGIITASLGFIYKNYGLSVTCIKIDPYLNIDAGTMSPYEHGEVFVLDDGAEVDLDLGNYERYLDINLSKENNITSGKIYSKVTELERQGKFLGQTIQCIPHVTNTIKEWILNVSKKPVNKSYKQPDICLIELGGTPGDIESMIFVESLRQLTYELGKDNIAHIHVTLIPIMTVTNEQKSKPAQRNIIDLRNLGLPVDVVICRSINFINENIRNKISLFGMVNKECILSLPDMKNIYEIPISLIKQNLPKILGNMIKLDISDYNYGSVMAEDIVYFDKIISTCIKRKIGIIGKYLESGSDCYFSLINSLKTSARMAKINLEIVQIPASNFQKEILCHEKNSFDGILIPGGFGFRGIEGMVEAANYARTRDIPFLGICLGMQIGVIEYARNHLKLKYANSTEFNEKTKEPVIIYMPEVHPHQKGGTMRVGSREVLLKKGSYLSRIYGGLTQISERHRHRYEVNPEFVKSLEKDRGMIFSGKDISGVRMEAFEIKKNKFYVGVQFHPEFKSRPLRPAPVIFEFIKAIKEK